ncbi:MAG TPA: sigma-70 family RNA polymerase sigma factor [Dehalococcoidia bacterium]|nr:sigma-70 family RNA polymerase sigma factor [Dehalococcoidia bacterium]
MTATRTDDQELQRDQELAERARSDSGAFAALYDLYVHRVYRYAFRRLGTHAEAEDLTAQTFQRVLEALPRFESRGLPFGAWLFRITHNLVVDRHRARRPAVSLDQIGESGEDRCGDDGDLDASLEQREHLDAAWAAVGQLPALQRRAVVLRFGRDLSHAEIGPLIGRSEAATKQLIYRAIKTLRQRLQTNGGTQ